MMPSQAKTRNIRIDQWLWAVRLFKTRSLASQSCRSGRIQIRGNAVRPSHPVRVGEIVSLKQPPILRQFLVKKLAAKRVSAALALDLVEEITPVADREKLERAQRDPLSVIFAREKGSGRPTKKERRHLEKLITQRLDDSES